MRRLLLLPMVALLAACGGGESATARGHDQALQACTAAAGGGGASSADALVHSHQAAGLDPKWQPMADAMGQIGVLQQSLGSDLGAGEDDTTGATALATVSRMCSTLGITVSPTAPQTSSPLAGLKP